jgi:hypothetical protein
MLKYFEIGFFRQSRTYVDNEGKGICDWDAPNVEVVNEILNKVLGGPPVDGAIEVKRVL